MFLGPWELSMLHGLAVNLQRAPMVYRLWRQPNTLKVASSILAGWIQQLFPGPCRQWWRGGWRGLVVEYIVAIDATWAPGWCIVPLEHEPYCSAHCEWHFICHKDQWCESFFVARAVFGDVGGLQKLRHALYMTFHMWRTSLVRVILRGRHNICWRWRMNPVAPRIVNDVAYMTDITRKSHFAWQVHYLLTFEDDQN